MITLTYQTTELELSDRLVWTDEYSWSPVVSENRWGTEGSLIVHTGKRKAGRPITLDGRASNAWITRATCDQLYAWASISGAEFSLLVRGVARTVVFDATQGAAFQAEPIWRLQDGEHKPELLYTPFFKFMEV
ncbi:hypothetical protein ACDW_22730 [Acidovorax sp. DW039]|uniref:hypothetical protein n=1 Tax=Acidovorax sp. DW039 TaxID=3095606 RepID=UPI00308B35AF|nr:hypothetical protein ACDW_22730 [Acidovorax sp. DW039]